MTKKEFYYEHILNDISGRIEDGEYGYREYLPSEREMADYYQVNRTTVRKALELLADKKYIEKRQGASSQVIYKKEQILPDRETEEEKVIGFFLPREKSRDFRPVQSFCMSLYYYIEMVCREHGCRVICVTVTDLEDFISLTRQYRFAGAFFMSKIRRDIVEYAKNVGLSAVAVNEKFPGMPCITMDNVNGGYLATKYLLDKGHRKIGFITGPDKYFTSEDRMLGAKKALNEFHVSVSDADVARADWTFDSGYAAMQQLLNRHESSWPTAVFAFNEEMAHGAAKMITEKHLSIPEDISLIGFGGDSSVLKYDDTIAMVDGSMSMMARTASTILMNLINHHGMDHELVIHLPVKLKEYDSVRELNKNVANAEIYSA